MTHLQCRYREDGKAALLKFEEEQSALPASGSIPQCCVESELLARLQQELAQLRDIAGHISGQQMMIVHHSMGGLNRSLLLQGRMAANQLRSFKQLGCLADAEFRITSQWGEDGIIEWLCQALPDIPRSFVEFGVENYSEANTRFLLENRGWRGLILDGNASAMQALREDALYWRHDLTAVGAFITRDNIRDLIITHGFHRELGILSIDIDGNDYWILEALSDLHPAILICEINGVFGDIHAITIPYRADFQRLEAHFSGVYFGCSIRALDYLATRLGFTFVGTNSNGVNAFFVRSDLAPAILERLDEVRIWPPRHRDSRDHEGRLSFVRGVARGELIANLPVFDVSTKQVVAVRDLGPLYSERFLQDFS
jgi:hypothetical protein